MPLEFTTIDRIRGAITRDYREDSTKSKEIFYQQGELGSGPRYQILSHVFARCVSQKTHGHARIARDSRLSYYQLSLGCPAPYMLFSLPVQSSRSVSTTCLRNGRLLRFELNSVETSNGCAQKHGTDSDRRDSESIATKVCSQITRK